MEKTDAYRKDISVMAGKNENLHKAKDAKQDEFYTTLPCVSQELNNYTDKFYDKVVYCNCDDPFESNFVKFFLMNFNRLCLKELIATGYATSHVRGTELELMDSAYVLRVKDTKKYLVGTQKDLDMAGAKYFLTAEKDNLTARLIGNVARDKNGNPIRISVKEKYTDENGKEKTRTIKQELFYEAGDFRSDMSIELLKQADIVVTNEPFSLFREYIAQLMEYGKQFLVLGNMNAITYKEFFPLLKDNKVWLGCSSGSKEYMTTEEYAKKNPNKVYQRGGKWYTKLGNTCWFTNLDHAKRHQMIPLDLGYTYYGHEDMYPKYDNYDAINVDKVAQIPCDYEPCWYKCPHATSCKYAQTEGKEDKALCEQARNGEIGVPISYLDKHCPEQFEILGSDNDFAKSMKDIAEDGTYEKGGPAFYLPTSEDLLTNCSSRERERETALSSKTLQQNCYPSKEDLVTESSECQSPSLINIAQSSSASYGRHLETREHQLQKMYSDISDIDSMQKTEAVVLSSTMSEHTDGYSFRKCNGNIGVPISLVEQHCPEQFLLLGITCRGYSPEYRTKLYSKNDFVNANDLNGSACILQNGTLKMMYGRLIIRRKDTNHHD